jgi:hypothetical protein
MTGFPFTQSERLVLTPEQVLSVDLWFQGKTYDQNLLEQPT